MAGLSAGMAHVWALLWPGSLQGLVGAPELPVLLLCGAVRWSFQIPAAAAHPWLLVLTPSFCLRELSVSILLSWSCYWDAFWHALICLAQDFLTLYLVFRPQTGCLNERASETCLKGKVSTSPLHWGWLCLRQSPGAPCRPCTVPALCADCHNKQSCVSFWVGGEGADVGANNQAFQSLGLPRLMFVCSSR